MYIDGGMCADPYKIASYARKMEVDQREILNHIHISRAFTVYQLTSIIQELLEPSIKRYKPRTLIIGKFPVLHMDSDVKDKEAKTLLRTNIHKIRELTTKYNLVTVFTNIDRGMPSNNRGLREIIYKDADEIVLMKQMELSTHVQLIKQQKNTVILDIAKGQMRLQEFGMVIA